MRKTTIYTFVCIFLIGFFFAGMAAGETVELKFAHFMSPKHIQHVNSFAPFCKKVEALSGGSVKIKIYPGGALGGPKQLPDAVKKGVTDIAFIIPSYTTARFPRTSVLDLPFLSESSVHATKVFYDLFDQYLAEDYKDYKVLWLYTSGPGHFMSINKAMPTMASINGMKMRTPSAYMSKLFKAIGANPVGMPIPKLTMSLQKKVIDGMLTPLSVIDDFSLFDIVRHVSISSLYTSPMAVVMNQKKWNSLSAEAKKAIDQAAGKQWGLHAAKVYDDQDADTAKEVKKRGKIKLIQMSKAELQKIKDAVKPLEDEWKADMMKKGHPAKELLSAAYASSKKNK